MGGPIEVPDRPRIDHGSDLGRSWAARSSPDRPWRANLEGKIAQVDRSGAQMTPSGCKSNIFIVFWYRNGWRNGCVDMLRAGRFSMVFSMLVLSIFRVAVPSLVFGEHSWDTGFCRVGCVFAMLIDGRFDATSRRSSRSIRQSLSLTILMENPWKINRKSPSNVVLHQIRLQNRSWEHFCLHFPLWGVLLRASG